MRITTLANNQAVYEDRFSCAFCSYGTEIAQYKRSEIELKFTPAWNYSHTTTKYLYKFLDEYVIPMADKKISDLVESCLNSSNKRKAFQDAIDKGLIKLVEDLD